MTNPINSLKFDISKYNKPSTPTNAATGIIQSGYIPSGAAIKNGWEEVKSVTDNIKFGIAGLYRSVMEMAGQALKLGANDSSVVVNIYKIMPQDVQITANTLTEIDKTWDGKMGFFRGNSDAMLAQQIVLDYYNTFDKVRALTSSMMVEIQDVLMQLVKTQEADNAVTDAVIKNEVTV